MAVSDHSPIDLGPTDNTVNDHTSIYDAETITANESSSDKVMALFNENAANMCLQLQQDDFHSLICFECAAHYYVLHAKDIVKISEVETAVSNAKVVLKLLELQHLSHMI
jgi:hypothetical protein